MASLIDANCLDGTALESAGRARIYDTVIPIDRRGVLSELFMGVCISRKVRYLEKLCDIFNRVILENIFVYR